MFARSGETSEPRADSRPRDNDDDDDRRNEEDGTEDPMQPLVGAGLRIGCFVAAAPIWIPRMVLDDSNSIEGYFPRFPYDHGKSGSMLIGEGTSGARRWSGRLRSDYAEDFDDLSRVGGNLLLSTTSRFDLDIAMNHFEERLADKDRDRLWLGDCNLVYRFAQGSRVQWRAGLGFNWLDDPIDTDFGFNFTYGVDVFPVKPWVLSAVLDWGTLGSADLFHFRTTAGVIIHGFEAYTGYEYYNIDRFQFSGLIAGVGLWF